MIYLTGAFRQNQIAALNDLGVGVMLQPGSGYVGQAERFPWWAADNGCYAQGDAFDGDAFYRWLARVPQSRLLFVVAPDVFGHHEATLERSRPYLEELGRLGLPRAFVAQNGAVPDTVPWDTCEWVFLGGTNEWKLGPPARAIVRMAHLERKGVHMGRVNSARRLLYATIIGCDSADGTFLKFRNRKQGRGVADLMPWFQQRVLHGLYR